MIRPFLLLSIALIFSSIGCSDSTDGQAEPIPPVEPESYNVVPAFPNLSFTNPLDLQHAGDGSGRLFVVEQRGTIQVFKNDPAVAEKNVFLDIQDRVVAGGERGLLGLAFHPNFKSNGYFYVNYTAANPLRSVISRFQVSSSNPDRAAPSSETVLLSFNQPFSNHNGGQIRFGPDGFLYIGVGDGGGAGDPNGNAQDRSSLLGSILRIDVDGVGNANNYAIPPENPFANNTQGFREEIYAYGLRNPFRFSFDDENGELWAGDVGQNEFEEIDLIKNGGNYGWNTMEGNACYKTDDCDKSAFEPAVFVYDHSNGDHSITGGFVYRGSVLENLYGSYIYADYISGRIWALDITARDNPSKTLLADTDLFLSSFGVDAQNELYICAFDGKIYRLKSS